MTSKQQPLRADGPVERYDAVIIGAGVSGMYALHHLRELGLSVRVYDGASDVGGTWWYNRYPGARVDGPGSPFYCYTFTAELMNEWDWEETQSEQSAVPNLQNLCHIGQLCLIISSNNKLSSLAICYYSIRMLFYMLYEGSPNNAVFNSMIYCDVSSTMSCKCLTFAENPV